MFFRYVFGMVLATAPAVFCLDPPTLPTNWKAITIDPPQPEGIEMYHFVDPNTASTKNPSAHWFKYPDCEKLEYYSRKDKVIENNYYLGCYSLDCCYENRGSGIKEWQVDPKAVYVGKHSIESFGEIIEADGWSIVYHAFPEKINYTYWITGYPESDPVLHRIDADVRGPVLLTTNIQYKDFQAVKETEEFIHQFDIPDVCLNNQVRPCPEDGKEEEASKLLKRVRSEMIRVMATAFM